MKTSTMTHHVTPQQPLIGADPAALRHPTIGHDLVQALARVAERTGQAVPGADGTVVTMLREEYDDLDVATTVAAARALDIERAHGVGPSTTAITTHCTITSGDLLADPRWPAFAARARPLPVRSALALPLISGEVVCGTIVVYAHARDAFDAHAVAVGEAIAATCVQIADVLNAVQKVNDQLQRALGSRATIDQAIGIIMSRTGCGPSEAFDRLRTRSQSDNVKLSVIAQRMVEQAVRSARARDAST